MIVSFVIALFYLPFDILYWLKWIIAYLHIRVHNRLNKPRFDLYDLTAGDDPAKLGFVVPQLEKDLESPLPECRLQEASDEVVFYGVNSKMEHLLLRVTRDVGGSSQAFVHLKMADGRSFHLVENGGFQQDINGFSCGSLQVRNLFPMRCWRIHFCGMLKETSEDGTALDEATFVKFVLLWKASSDVYDINLHTNPKGIASAIANTSWNSFFIPPIEQFSQAMDLYAQSGTLSGTVSVNDGEEYEIYLFGEKMRNLGKKDLLMGSKFTTVMGKTPENGFTFHVANLSAPKICQNLSLGFVVRSDMILEVADKVNISCAAEDPKKKIKVEFMSGKNDSKYEMVCNPVGGPLIVDKKHDFGEFLRISYINFNIKDKKGFGFIIEGEINSSLKTRQKAVPKAVCCPKYIPLTTNLADEISQIGDISGGKGASLSKLIELSQKVTEFDVPKGIVITTEAYKKFLNGKMLKALQKLADVAYGNVEGDIKETCKAVCKTICKSTLQDEICSAIFRELKNVFGYRLTDVTFAVRSSATGEDTGSMSAAGQMKSFLGVQDLEGVYESVKKCWASQFSYNAVQYKRQNGQPLNNPMAVVVQEMVPCEAAGVLFTCDPLTGNPAHITISANYGLGESVVDGSVEPDEVVIKRRTDGRLETKFVKVGSKHKKTIMSESGEVVSEELNDELKGQCCISEEMAERLAKLSIEVEKYYHSCRDIEWGVKESTIFLFQSRPVTSVSATTDYEIIHDFDTALKYENEYFSMANVGEVMPGAATPISVEVLFKVLGNGWRRIVMKNGGADNMFQCNYFMTGCMQFYNHLMMTVFEIISRYGLDSITTKGMMVSVFGRVLDDPDILSWARGLVCNEASSSRSLMQTIHFIWDLFTHHLGGEKVKKDLESIDPFHSGCKNSSDMFKALMNSCYKYEEAFLRHMKSSENSSNWNMYIFEILCKSNEGKFDSNVYSDFSRLLRSTSGVESADVPQTIKRLAYQIGKDIDCTKFKEMSIEEAEEWLRLTESTSGLKFKEFLKRHGHRCYKESDMRSPTWEMDVKPLIEILQNSCDYVKKEDESDDDIDKIFSELNVPLGIISRLLLKFIIPNSRRAVKAREFFKSLSMRSVDHWRKGYTRLAQLMVSEGRLPDADLIFFFKMDEISNLLETRSPTIISRALHRRRLFPATDKLKFPAIMRGFPKPMDDNDSHPSASKPDLVLKGTPVSQGVAKGYARVVLHIKEASTIKPGEILITCSTDIGWSPYFPILSGVVTELGGLISHGAVVSREYGIPCVVGLHEATKIFQTGDYVFLDGKNGTLQKLPSPPS